MYAEVAAQPSGRAAHVASALSTQPMPLPAPYTYIKLSPEVSQVHMASTCTERDARARLPLHRRRAIMPH